MNAKEETPEAGRRSIPLRFEINAQDGSKFTRQLLRRRRIAWIAVLRKIAALGMGCLAVDFAIKGAWIIAVLIAWAAASTWSDHMVWLWLMRTFFARMTTMAELELYSTGVRGEFKYRSGWSWGNDDKRVNYAWHRLRQVERLPDYLIFEYHGGSEVIIPIRAFASPLDLEQCEAWAQAGLSA